MIASVAREFNWPPLVIGGLFIDKEDYMGLVFWYNDAVKTNNKIKELTKI